MTSKKIIAISDKPLLCYPRMAYQLKSADKALLLQKIIDLQNNSNDIYDGHKWVRGTIQDFQNFFPWLCKKTVQRYLKEFENKEMLIVTTNNKSPFDRTKWYRVNDSF